MAEHRPQAVLHVADGTFHRYLYCLAKCLEAGGYQVSVNISARAVAAADVYVRLLLDDSLVRQVTRSATPTTTLHLNDERGIRVLTLSADYFDSGAECRLPMPMHPFMHSRGYVLDAPALSQKRRRPVRMFYAGSRGASDLLLTRCFGVTPRERVLSHIMEPGSRISHSLMLSRGQLAEEYSAGILLAIRETCDIPQERLLEAMSNASFFLALPGWIVPQSHNLTECMSVGSVPILQYASFLAQPLHDGVNCLVYNDLDHLEMVIDRARGMHEDSIEEMRQNVLKYYDEILSPVAVAGRVRDCTSGVITVMAEQASVALAATRLVKRGPSTEILGCQRV